MNGSDIAAVPGGARADMPRRVRHPGECRFFHALNRAIQGLALFETSADYEMWLGLVREAAERFRVRLLAYALMPNHWHLVLWCADHEALSRFMHWLGTTHAQRWRASKRSRGLGAVYQGRFKSIAVQCDGHLLRVCRYVERNPLRARMVARAEDWPWSSASPKARAEGRPTLADWPFARPEPWLDVLNQPEPPKELQELRRCVATGMPFGFDDGRRFSAGGSRRQWEQRPKRRSPADGGSACSGR
jgi:putative transposase